MRCHNPYIILYNALTIECILDSGMQEIAYNSGSSKAKVQSVLLLTDGLATDGVTTKEGILAEMLKIQSPEDKSKKVSTFA